MKDNILVTGSSGFIGSMITGGKAYKGKIEDYYSLFIEADGVHGIVHLAAKSNNRLCEKEPEKGISSNLIGLCNVLEVALKKDIWVLFISSYQVRDKTFYGLSKLMGEEICRIYHQKGVKVKITRLPIVYGPGDKPDKIVNRLITELKSGSEPIIGTNRKFSFAYVDDIARAIENEVEVLEGGYGKKYSLVELVDGIKKCLKEGEKND